MKSSYNPRSFFKLQLKTLESTHSALKYFFLHRSFLLCTSTMSIQNTLYLKNIYQNNIIFSIKYNFPLSIVFIEIEISRWSIIEPKCQKKKFNVRKNGESQDNSSLYMIYYCAKSTIGIINRH